MRSGGSWTRAPRALVVHGGAWDIPQEFLAAHRDGCHRALEAGWQVLAGAGSALDAVEVAIRALEDDETFDAGVGAVLNREGVAELDAAIMDGETLDAGAVAGVRRVRSPITVARRLLGSGTVMLVADGAESFAQRVGVPLCDPAELIVARERQRWQELSHEQGFRTEHAFGAGRPAMPAGTVGAVALDGRGRIAAGNSTGGTPFKAPGRVGDSPLVGCGLYADRHAGCAATGWGESIIRVVLAKAAVDLVASGEAPVDAARLAVNLLGDRGGGLGGCILLDRAGCVGWAFNTPRMAYVWRTDESGALMTVE